jgi:NTE family protein
VLNKESLAEATDCQLQFPSIFPVEIDGKLLVDGGVTNNYPIDEVKKAWCRYNHWCRHDD